MLLLRHSYQGKAAVVCMVKYQAASLLLCLSVILPICVSVSVSSMPVRLSTLPFFPPSVVLLVDSCRVSEAIAPLLLLTLFVSWIVRVCLHVFAPLRSHGGLGGVCLHVCTSVCVCVCVCVRLRLVHPSVKRLLTGY